MSSESNFEAYVGCSAFTLVSMLIVGLILTSLFGGCMPNYAQGERVGELIKISKKGMVFQSWEGELVLNQFAIGKDGSNLFEFSTLDDNVGRKLEELAGKRVKVKYHQYLIGPMQQSTKYTVTEVMELPK